MGNEADFIVREAKNVTLFVGAWTALAIVIGIGYGKVCKLADRNRERDLRRLLVVSGRDARRPFDEAYHRDMKLAQLIHDADEAARAAVDADNAARDERAALRLVDDLQHARLTVVPDVAELA